MKDPPTSDSIRDPLNNGKGDHNADVKTARRRSSASQTSKKSTGSMRFFRQFFLCCTFQEDPDLSRDIGSSGKTHIECEVAESVVEVKDGKEIIAIKAPHKETPDVSVKLQLEEETLKISRAADQRAAARVTSKEAVTIVTDTPEVTKPKDALEVVKSDRIVAASEAEVKVDVASLLQEMRSKSQASLVATATPIKSEEIGVEVVKRPAVTVERLTIELDGNRDSFVEEEALLGPVAKKDIGKICLVLDLDETLVHSSFEPTEAYHFTLDVEYHRVMYQVYVRKRPHVDEFLQTVGPLFECVLFTASMSKYADAVVDKLDPEKKIFSYRLFRESCHNHETLFVKNLSELGRPLDRVAIMDNSPSCYHLQQQNAVPIRSWYRDPDDNVLLDMAEYMKRLAEAKNVPDFLREHPPPSGLDLPPDSDTPSKSNMDPKDIGFSRGRRRERP